VFDHSSWGNVRQQADGIVSVWSGHFASQRKFAEYIRANAGGVSAFCSHAGLGAFDVGEMEAAFYDAVPVPALEALREFPAGQVFGELAATALHIGAAAGWNGLVLLHDCSYSPNRAHPSQACRLTYVGSFEYR
jgi:hypothetical protein